jgi:hypothetical protein
MATASNNSGSGCLVGFAYLYIIGVSIVAFAMTASKSFEAGSIFGAIVVWSLFAGMPLAIARWVRKRAATKAREAAEERQRALDEAATRRWHYLCSTYGQENAEKIAGGKVWVGATVAMMTEIHGPPVAVDEKVMKTKVSRTYKYNPTGVNRYALRVYVEDGEVIGWENKDD